jgi:hypothetical protein
VFKTDRYIATVARAALKRKKVLEQNLITTQQHINTLEQQMNAVETANLNLETVKVMKEASDAMKIMNKRVGINDIDETMCVQPPALRRALFGSISWLILRYTIQGGDPREHATQQGNLRSYRKREPRRRNGGGRARGDAGRSGAGGTGYQDDQCPFGPFCAYPRPGGAAG